MKHIDHNLRFLIELIEKLLDEETVDIDRVRKHLELVKKIKYASK